jgi:hypothetical protein
MGEERRELWNLTVMVEEEGKLFKRDMIANNPS